MQVAGCRSTRVGRKRLMGSKQASAGARPNAPMLAFIASLVILMLAGMLLPRVGWTQAGRRGPPVSPGGYGAPYGAPSGGYVAPGGGYGSPGGSAPAPPAYPPAGYGAPAPQYAPGGYGPPGSPPQGYAPPAYQPPYAYPPPGQNPQQAAAAQMQCQSWASAQSGFNPNAPQAGVAGETSGQAAMAGAGSVVRGGGEAPRSGPSAAPSPATPRRARRRAPPRAG